MPEFQTHTTDTITGKKNSRYHAYFDAVWEKFKYAVSTKVSESNRYFRLNDFSIRLCFGGPALIPAITPALQHLSFQEAIPGDLTVLLWDSVSTGIEIPDIPWKINDQFIPGEIWSYDDGELMILFQPANNTIQLLDKSRNLAIYWVQDAAHVPFHDRGSPLRLILQRWLRIRGFQVVHAGAVGYPEGGVILVGKGGSGKSTTTFTCLDSDLSYAGDDFCMVSDNPVPRVFSLYNTGKLDPKDMKRFPSLQPALSNPDNEKALYFLYDQVSEKISPGFPVKAILIPEITGRMETTLKKVSPARGFLALAPTTVYLVPKAEQREVNEGLSVFVRKTPNYILELGTDLNRIPGVISGLLKTL